MLNYINNAIDFMSFATKQFVGAFSFDKTLKELTNDQIDANVAYARATAKVSDAMFADFQKSYAKMKEGK